MQAEFEPIYYGVVVKYISHYARVTNPRTKLKYQIYLKPVPRIQPNNSDFFSLLLKTYQPSWVI